VDPDPTFHTDADPDSNPSFQIKAQTLEKVLIFYAKILAMKGLNPSRKPHVILKNHTGSRQGHVCIYLEYFPGPIEGWTLEKIEK
jgi:hypothetical protein